MSNKKIKEYIFDGKMDIANIIKDFVGYVFVIIKNSKYNFNNEDIEEIASDVFLAIWQNRKKLDISKEIKPYIAGITKNLILKKQRTMTNQNVNIEFLEKLGYENQTINRIELKRGYDEGVDSYYMVKTKWGYEEGLMVQLNANGGDFIAFNDMDLKYKHLNTQELKDEEIGKVATDIYNTLGIEEGKYTLTKTTAQDYCFENQTNILLGANFYKYYDGIANKNESFNVSFLNYNGEIYLNSILIGTDNTYQNNPVVITEEEAINIAKKKEQELSPNEITNIISSLSIEKMNAFIYQLENDKYDVTGTMEDETYYKTENITRKVWKIKIEHNAEWKDYMDHNQYVKEGMGKIYFIDATTGEIIGGTHTYFEE